MNSSPPLSPAWLVLDDVSFGYGRGPAVNQSLSLALGPGIVGLPGSNGASKSTLMRSSRPYELVFLIMAHATSQGLWWLDASARGPGMLVAHASAVLVALVVLGVPWVSPRRPACAPR